MDIGLVKHLIHIYMIRFSLTLYFLFIMGNLFARQQTSDAQRAIFIYNAVNKYLLDNKKNHYLNFYSKKESSPPCDLWTLGSILQASDEIEKLSPHRPLVAKVSRMLEQYYRSNAIPAYSSNIISMGGGDRYYDDNLWIGLAFLDVYTRTHQQSFLNKSKEIYQFVMSGYDRIDGGIYWNESDKVTKNACSNGPAILLALRLHEISGQKIYLDTALSLYRWINKHLQSKTGLYWDKINLPPKHPKIDSAIYPYNSGVMLEVNVRLYKITKDKSYLKEAQRIADASFLYFFLQGKIHSCHWINAVLVRGYESFYSVNPEKKYLLAVKIYTDMKWNDSRDVNNLIGRGDKKTLLDQAGMIEMYARLSRLLKDTN